MYYIKKPARKKIKHELFNVRKLYLFDFEAL